MSRRRLWLAGSRIIPVWSLALPYRDYGPIPHAHASCDSAVTCPYIGQKDLTAVVFKARYSTSNCFDATRMVDATWKNRSLFRSIFNVCSPMLWVLGNPLRRLQFAGSNNAGDYECLENGHNPGKEN